MKSRTRIRADKIVQSENQSLARAGAKVPSGVKGGRVVSNDSQTVANAGHQSVKVR